MVSQPSAFFWKKPVFVEATNLLQSAALRERAAAVADQFALWAKLCPANFAHRRALIEAEVLRAAGAREAGDAFAKAVSAAEARGWTHDAALANERAAAYFRGIGSVEESHRYAAASVAAYRNWGASAKARDAEAAAGLNPR